jgi:hypothetical protein
MFRSVAAALLALSTSDDPVVVLPTTACANNVIKAYRNGQRQLPEAATFHESMIKGLEMHVPEMNFLLRLSFHTHQVCNDKW